MGAEAELPTQWKHRGVFIRHPFITYPKTMQVLGEERGKWNWLVGSSAHDSSE